MTILLSTLFTFSLLACQYNTNQQKIKQPIQHVQELDYKNILGTQINTRYRFAATRSWRFRRRKLSATNGLDTKHKA